MLANKARRILITIGKIIPFVLCFVVSIAYLETIYALLLENYLYFWDCTILNTPLSFFIASIFEYDLLVCIITLIISIAIEACKWNIWATFYLFIHLAEKSYFDFELEPFAIYSICVINILVAGYLTYKGVYILLKT